MYRRMYLDVSSSSSSSCVVMFVSILVRLSFVCCAVSHHLFCQIGIVDFILP